jgi:uncharacterized protein DUF4386
MVRMTTNGRIEAGQRTAAKIVGIAYLVALVTANFAEIYVPSRLIVANDATRTAANIIAGARLFRLGIAADLITFAIDVVLIVALYRVLRPVNRSVAMLATLWRVIETAVMVVATLTRFDVLRLLSGAEYLRGLEVDQVRALARLSVGAYGSAYQVGLFFFGLGSATFAWLWWQSRYVPRLLAGWGIFAAALVSMYVLTITVVPDLANSLMLPSLIPIAVFELAIGVWLLSFRLRFPTAPLASAESVATI